MLRKAKRKIEFTVHGDPKPQGSKKAIKRRDGGVSLVESAGGPLKEWRYAVAQKAAEVMGGESPWQGPLFVEMVFYLPRPKGHYGTGRNAGKLKPSAPEYHDKRPDSDKLCRSVCDSLSKRVYHDDSQIVELTVTKNYTTDSGRVVIRVREVG